MFPLVTPRQSVSLSPSDQARLVEAIGRAEQGSRAEVRVHLEARCVGEPLERARAVFDKLGMRRTVDDTGVLLYVAVDDRVASVYAGQGLYAASEPTFWQEAINDVARGYAAGNGVDGLMAALERLGELLRQTVPGEDVAGDELPNQVSHY